MEITDFKSLNRGALKASFNVLIPEWGMTIRSCALFEKDGRRWIGYPSRTYDDPENGKKKYYSYILFDEKVKPKFEESVLKALKKFND